MPIVRETLHGRWWVSTAPHRAVDGMLVLEEETTPRLEVRDELFDFDTNEGPLTIHGDVSGHQATLLAVYPDEARIVLRGGKQHITQTMTVALGVLIGDQHVTAADSADFALSTVEMNYLHSLAGELTLGNQVVSGRDASGAVTYTQAVTAKQGRTGTFGDLTVNTVTESFNNPIHSSFESGLRMPSRFATVLELTSDRPVSVEHHLTAARLLSDLVTLGVGRPAHIRRITFNPSAGWDRAGRTYQWWGAAGSGPLSVDEVIDEQARRKIFDLNDVDFGVLLPAWHELVVTAGSGVQSIINLQRGTGTSQSRLLDTCLAIEALHRGFHPSRMDYRNRCRSLAEIPDPDVVRRMIPDIDRWADYVTKSRNALAHGYPPQTRRQQVPDAIWYVLHEPTLALLILVLLCKLGIPSTVQVRALEGGALRHAAQLGTTQLR